MGGKMFFDDIKLGMTVDIAPAVIEKEKMLDFARLYDNIPLHTDEEYAKTTPFGGIIAPGVMSFMAVWAKYEGVGCCWVMHFDPAAMRKTFNIPEEVEPAALLVMGYPSETAKPLDMHYSTRPMDEVVFYDSF